MQNKTKTYLVLAAIITLGIFLRVVNIENTPPGIYPDEAVNGIDALAAIDSGEYQWFYPANNGREGFFMNAIAVFFQLFGVSVLTLKLPAIISGVLTIWGVYLLGKELFSSVRIGLIASFLTAVSFWTINFSRISFRANMLAPILAFSFYFLFRGLRTKKWTDFALGGLIFGFGMHSYIAFRIAPAILIVMFIVFLFNRQHFLKTFWKQILVFVLFTALSAAPMIYTLYIAHPEYAESRSASISILSPEVNGGHLFETFFKSLSLSVLKYNFWGDQNWRHNFPPYPLLDPLTGAAFMFGLVYATLKFFHLLYLRFSKKISDEKTEVFAFLLSAFFLMLTPEFMTAEGNPHALRAIGTIPFVFILAAIPFNYFYGAAQNKTYVYKKITFGLIFLMLFSLGIFNAAKYHLVWAKKAKTAEAFDKNIMDAQKYIKGLPKEEEIFLATGNMQRIPPRLFNWGNPNFHDLHPSEIDDIIPKDPRDFTIIFTDHDKDEIIRKIKSRFPEMQLETREDEFGLKFYILK